MPFFSKSGYVLEGFQTSCAFNFIDQSDFSRTIVIMMSILGFFVPIAVIIISYTLVFITVKIQTDGIRYSRQETTSANPRVRHSIISIISHSSKNKTNQKPRNSLEKLQKKLKPYKNELIITKRALIIITGFCISWLPYAIISMIAQFCKYREKYVTPYSTFIAALLFKFSTILNPIIFIFNNRKFRKSFSKL